MFYNRVFWFYNSFCHVYLFDKHTFCFIVEYPPPVFLQLSFTIQYGPNSLYDLKPCLISMIHSKGDFIIAVTPQLPTSRPVAQ